VTSRTLGLAMRSRSHCRIRILPAYAGALLGLGLCLVFTEGAHAQQTPQNDQDGSQLESTIPEEAVKNPNAPCIQPTPMVSWRDYEGPLNKVVGMFGRKLERKSTGTPHYKPGAILCSLDAKDKFVLFVEDTFDPVTFLGAAFNAGIDQAKDTDPSFGQGAQGYGHRFAAEFIGNASGDFFKDFAYPTIFSEDPRYYRLGHGSFPKRFAHAMGHAVIAYREDGTHMFNISEWLGSASTATLANTYHPDNRRGVGPVAQRVGFGVLNDCGYDVLREFWPEIAHKFKLPFRQEPEGGVSGSQRSD
jgi:hypothetical protein